MALIHYCTHVCCQVSTSLAKSVELFWFKCQFSQLGCTRFCEIILYDIKTLTLLLRYGLRPNVHMQPGNPLKEYILLPLLLQWRRYGLLLHKQIGSACQHPSHRAVTLSVGSQRLKATQVSYMTTIIGGFSHSSAISSIPTSIMMPLASVAFDTRQRKGYCFPPPHF